VQVKADEGRDGDDCRRSPGMALEIAQHGGHLAKHRGRDF
jgi:hypothetical protein